MTPVTGSSRIGPEDLAGGEGGDELGVGQGEPGLAVGVRGVPPGGERPGLVLEGADVGDLDADRPAVGLGGVPGAFLEVERLVDRAVDVEHELDAQPALVVEHLEALLARAADVEVDDELVDLLLQEREVPAAAADLLALLGGQARPSASPNRRSGLGISLSSPRGGSPTGPKRWSSR